MYFRKKKKIKSALRAIGHAEVDPNFLEVCYSPKHF